MNFAHFRLGGVGWVEFSLVPSVATLRGTRLEGLVTHLQVHRKVRPVPGGRLPVGVADLGEASELK